MNNNLVLDVEDNPKKVAEWFIFALQHILAMLVACITVPLITGLPVAATLIAAGMGTIIYIICTKKKSPVFLSSSFAYIAPMTTALATGGIAKVLSTGDTLDGNYAAIMIGMALVGLVYVLVAVLIHFVGAKWLNKLLPPIVIGPVIMVIGLSLAGSAINNLTVNSGASVGYSWPAIICGLVAMFTTALVAHYGKNHFISLIPFVIGISAGYVIALIFTGFAYIFDVDYLRVISFKPFEAIFSKDTISFASFVNYKIFVPNSDESFIFLRFDQIKQFNPADIITILGLFVPVALVTVCEHIGDHENLGSIIGRDLLNEEPGLQRTLLGDGLATAASGVICGAANTTYGENVAVIGTTKIASVNVVLLAAILSIVIGFITPLTALLSTIPSCVTGGVSLILYGFIASSGVKMLIAEKVNFNIPRNIFIASVILVAGIGGLVFTWTLPGFNGNAVTITITPVAVAMILGILLNVILWERSSDKVESEEKPANNEEAKVEPVEETQEVENEERA